MTHFRALETFYSPELKSEYVEGMFYTAREEDDVLNSLLTSWLKDGRIEIDLPSASMNGS